MGRKCIPENQLWLMWLDTGSVARTQFPSVGARVARFHLGVPSGSGDGLNHYSIDRCRLRGVGLSPVWSGKPSLRTDCARLAQ